MEYFGRAERMQSDLRIARFQLPEQVFVKIDPQFRVQAALQQQLVAAQREGFLDFLGVLFDRGDVGPFGLVRLAVKIAEFTTRNADVRDVDIAVDLPRYHVARNLLLAQFPCE